MKPLTQLLKNNSFLWGQEAQLAFENLKQIMGQSLVLALPNFNDTFTIEADALGQGIGAVLMQKGHPIAFFSQALTPRHLTPSTYERELLAIIQAVQRWHQYLMDRHFIIKTDQQSLKYLLENKISTPFQQKWLSKLLGYDYEILYKKGIENKVANALSRITTAELLHLAVSSSLSDLMEIIKEAWQHDPHLAIIITELQ